MEAVAEETAEVKVLTPSTSGEKEDKGCSRHVSICRNLPRKPIKSDAVNADRKRQIPKRRVEKREIPTALIKNPELGMLQKVRSLSTSARESIPRS